MSQSLLDECRDGIISEVKSKIKDGSMNEANSDGSTPLYIASQEGLLEVVKFLIASEGSVNEANDEV